MPRTILISLAFCFCLESSAQTGKAVLEIENIQLKKGGDIAAAVFDGKNFLKNGNQVAAAIKKVTAGKMVFVFDNLPAGDYAFVAYQDIDRNKSMKKNFIGYPIEPFGISNNPSLLFGPPSFNESKVKITAEKTTALTIRLR